MARWARSSRTHVAAWGARGVCPVEGGQQHGRGVSHVTPSGGLRPSCDEAGAALLVRVQPPALPLELEPIDDRRLGKEPLEVELQAAAAADERHIEVLWPKGGTGRTGGVVRVCWGVPWPTG